MPRVQWSNVQSYVEQCGLHVNNNKRPGADIFANKWIMPVATTKPFPSNTFQLHVCKQQKHLNNVLPSISNLTSNSANH